MDLSFVYNSYGTIYGTVRAYDSSGNDIGAEDITDWGIWFSLRSEFGAGGTRILIKSIGTGITITNGTGGYYTIALQSKDMMLTAKEYAYGVLASPAGTAYSEGTTDIKNIGGGKFIILDGVRL